MSAILHEIKLALASLRRTPGFFLTVASTLGIALAALVCIAGVNRLLFLEPLPYPQQDRLFVAQGVVLDKGEVVFKGLHTYPALLQLYQTPGVFERAGLMDYQKQFLTSDPTQPRLEVTYASSGVFDLTGARAQLGRTFGPDEEVGKTNPVAVLSHRTWQANFGGDPDIVGKKVALDGASFTVVGVLAADYAEPALHSLDRLTDVYLPWESNPRDQQARQDWENFDSNLRVVGRLKPGVTAEQAGAALGAPLNERFRAQTAGVGAMATVTVQIEPLSFARIIGGDSNKVALMLLAGVCALLLIASANVSNLFLARTAQKQRQLSIQAALGANRGHLFRNMFAEAGILMLAASSVALLLAAGGYALLRHYGHGKIPRVQELALDPVSAVFIIAVGLVLALVFAALSIRMVNYKALAAFLQSGGKGAGMQISNTTRKVLIASQIAIASLLLVGNFGLLKESLQVLGRDAGFATTGLYEVNLSAGEQQLSPEQSAQQMQAIDTTLSAWPNVESVSFAGDGPTSTAVWASTLKRDMGSQDKFTPNTNRIDARYLKQIGLPVVYGREFTTAEVNDKAQAILVNETLAKAINPAGSAVGTNLFWNKKTEPYRVVGVVKDVFLPTVEPVQRVYLAGTTNMNLVVKVKDGQALDKAALVSAVAAINPTLRVVKLTSVEEAYRKLLTRDATTATITFSLAVLALFLAGLGVYGVLSYSIKLRRHELGIRMALGAAPRRIMALVYRDSMIPVAFGLAASALGGILLYAFLRQSMERHLNMGVLPALVTLVLVVLTVSVACYLPVRRILGQWPQHALRGDAAL
ncbi:MAG: ABC transporter permease [Pseudomonadota bacterium]